MTIWQLFRWRPSLCDNVRSENLQGQWNPHQVRFQQSSRSVEEEMTMQRNLSAVLQYECVVSEEVNTVRTYDIDAMQLRLIASVNVIDTTKYRKIAQVDVADVPADKTFASTERHTSVTPEDLSERWGIRLQQAKETLKRTTQKIVQSANMPLGRRYRADQNFEKPRLRGDWSTNTLYGHVVSKAGNRYGQVFANKSYFAAIYPMDSKERQVKH